MTDFEDPKKSCMIYFNNYPHTPALVNYSDGREYEGWLGHKSFEPEGKGIARL